MTINSLPLSPPQTINYPVTDLKQDNLLLNPPETAGNSSSETNSSKDAQKSNGINQVVKDLFCRATSNVLTNVGETLSSSGRALSQRGTNNSQVKEVSTQPTTASTMKVAATVIGTGVVVALAATGAVCLASKVWSSGKDQSSISKNNTTIQGHGEELVGLDREVRKATLNVNSSRKVTLQISLDLAGTASNQTEDDKNLTEIEELFKARREKIEELSKKVEDLSKNNEKLENKIELLEKEKNSLERK